MRILMALLLPVTLAVSGLGQDITVYVIDDGKKQPLSGIYLNLRLDCENPNRPKGIQQKSDASGMAVFHDVSLKGEPVCVDLFSVAYAYSPLQLDYVFVSPDKVSRYRKSLNPILTALSAEVTFHVRKRSLAQQLHFMFRGD